MTHAEWLEGLSFRKLQRHCEAHPDDAEALELLQELAYDHDPLDYPDDTPCLQNCDDAGTGEGRWHGRM